MRKLFGRRTAAQLAAAGITVLLVITLSAVESVAWAIQCVPYARQISGIDLYGAAWTWWHTASGQYARGSKPNVGAALVFKRLHGMPSGHVAVVTEIVNDRMIKVSHANWTHHGRRGRIERDAKVVDESPNNDWSAVRVWYAPTDDFGVKVYPTYGFVYPNGYAAVQRGREG